VNVVNLSAAILMMRVVAGALFAGHGMQKLTTRGGGHGFAGTTAMFAQMGIRPARPWAAVAITGEIVGGVLFGLGLLTPIAALALVADMAVAVAAVHWGKGLWISKGGYEYNLVLATMAAAVGLFGPGRYSVDAHLARALPEPWTFLVGLVPVALATLVATGRLQLPRPRRTDRGRPAPAV
jgi:putative oxidoreductase